MRAVCVRGRHFNSRQPSGLNIKIISIFQLRDESSSWGVLMHGIKNTSARHCTKNAGVAYVRGGAYLLDTTVYCTKMEWRRRNNCTSGRTANCTGVSYCSVTLYEILAICSYPWSLHWVVFLWMSSSLVPRFFPCALIKNWKESRESCKIYYVRNIKMQRELVCEHTNLAMLYYQNVFIQMWKSHGLQDYTPLHYITWQYNKLW